MLRVQYSGGREGGGVAWKLDVTPSKQGPFHLSIYLPPHAQSITSSTTCFLYYIYLLLFLCFFSVQHSLISHIHTYMLLQFIYIYIPLLSLSFNKHSPYSNTHLSLSLPPINSLPVPVATSTIEDDINPNSCEYSYMCVCI